MVLELISKDNKQSVIFPTTQPTCPFGVKAGAAERFECVGRKTLSRLALLKFRLRRCSQPCRLQRGGRPMLCPLICLFSGSSTMLEREGNLVAFSVGTGMFHETRSLYGKMVGKWTKTANCGGQIRTCHRQNMPSPETAWVRSKI
eukprot:SAG11_NODE_8884_length_966_cov_31.587082_1_plen_145_part_00